MPSATLQAGPLDHWNVPEACPVIRKGRKCLGSFQPTHCVRPLPLRAASAELGPARTCPLSVLREKCLFLLGNVSITVPSSRRIIRFFEIFSKRDFQEYACCLSVLDIYYVNCFKVKSNISIKKGNNKEHVGTEPEFRPRCVGICHAAEPCPWGWPGSNAFSQPKSGDCTAGQLDSRLRTLLDPPSWASPCVPMCRRRQAVPGSSPASPLQPSLSQLCLGRSIPNLHSAVPSRLLSILNDRPWDAIGGELFCGPL